MLTMITCFLVPYNLREDSTATSEFVIDPGWYEELLQKRWPDIKIFSEKTFLLSWSISEIIERIDGERQIINGFYGGLDKDKQVVSVKPMSSASLYEFICWHRSIISTQIPLFLTYTVDNITWDQRQLEITSDTTKEEIFDFLAPDWGPIEPSC